jgi:hypothetical protein
MTPELIAAAVRLADTITRENAALTALDLAGAAGMLAEKNEAADAFTAAQAIAARLGPVWLPGWQRGEAKQLAARLRALAQENKRLLEHAIAVQGRVIGMVARAAAEADTAQTGPRYSARGGPPAARPAAMALSARA